MIRLVTSLRSKVVHRVGRAEGATAVSDMTDALFWLSERRKRQRTRVSDS